MNICFVSREVYPFVRAGIGVYVYNACRLLQQKGHTVYLVTDQYDLNTLSEALPGVHLVTVDQGGVIEKEIFSNFNLYYSYCVYQTLATLTQTILFDLIEFSDYFGESYFTLQEKKVSRFLTQTPVVLKLHTPLHDCLRAAKKEIEPFLQIIAQEDYCIQQADGLSAISNSLAESLTQRLSLTQPVTTLLNPLGLTQIRPNTYQSGDEKIIMFVGKLQYLKGVDLLMSACLHHLLAGISFKVRFIGLNTEGQKEKLIAQIPEHLISCFEFIDFAERQEVLDHFNHAYVSVFPSRWEGLSNVSIESVTNGCPVLLSNAGGLKELKNFGDFGLYFESENLEELTEELGAILIDEKMRNHYAGNCCTQSQVFLNDNVYQKQYDFYQQIMALPHNLTTPVDLSQVIHGNLMHSAMLNKELHQEIQRLTSVISTMNTQQQMLEQALTDAQDNARELSEQLAAKVTRIPKRRHLIYKGKTRPAPSRLITTRRHARRHRHHPMPTYGVIPTKRLHQVQKKPTVASPKVLKVPMWKKITRLLIKSNINR